MTPLWIAVGIVTLVVVAVLAMALLRRRQSDATRLDYDLAVYKDQLKELERDLARGAISDTEAEAGRACPGQGSGRSGEQKVVQGGLVRFAGDLQGV